MTKDYAKALEAHNAAVQAFVPVEAAYRARRIGDDEYLTARKIFTAASAAFDAAYAAEASKVEG